MRKLSRKTATTITLAVVFSAGMGVMSLLPVLRKSVNAATTGSLYSYDFRGVTLTSPVVNGASANTTTGLTLFGNWTKSSFGIHFDGDKATKQSVAYAKPKSGNTIAVPANQAFGGTIMFQYTGPTAGSGCLGDSRNLTQIGRFGAGLTQFKLQFSNCGTNSKNVYPECRVAGSKNTTDVPLVRSSQALVTGSTYVLQCVKTPDPTSGKTTVQLKTTRVDAINTNYVTTDSVQISPTGTLTSTAYLSVANKYTLPAIKSNTDQFVGDVAKVAYCSGATVLDAMACLDTEIPTTETVIPTPPIVDVPETEPEPEVPPVPEVPVVVDYVKNKSFETDTVGWTGIETSGSKNTRVSGGYDGANSFRSVNSTSTAGRNGFISKPLWLDGTAGKATVAGKVYTGSAWVKPDAVGQKISIYLREIGSGATVGSKTVTITATSTNWQQIVNPYTAKASGNSMAFHVFATNSAAGKGFNADMLSLIIN